MNDDARPVTDPELAALATITEELARFDMRTRKRMLEWVVSHQTGRPWIDLPMPKPNGADAAALWASSLLRLFDRPR